MQLKPTKLTVEQALKLGKVLLYVLASGAVAALATWVTDNKDMFGVYYPIANVVLVLLKQIFTKPS